MAQDEDIKTYLKMQSDRYEERASIAVVHKDRIENECVVGTYDLQEKFPYDDNILKTFDKNTNESIVLEYGCGPGRNLKRLAPRFKKVIGVDIGLGNIKNAEKLLTLNNYNNFEFYHTTGDNIPLPDNSVDLIFEVICFQHICSYSIRSRILNDMVRVLKPTGTLIIQMGFNKEWKPDNYVDYFTDKLLGVKDTNGWCDACVRNEKELINDFENRGLTSVTTWLTDGVNDPNHPKWIWCSGKKS